ncbi:3'(2'),5'-bisphosphate nucleotidase CysQ [Mesorhizobium sp. CAU 1741]|uniref:3'(2'),5'-bisphosphate nucleotidase CysQ n=1 Tax=Mesorhizobium sp. CAU 1741 TaxID=3140366 RepID=UPI00325AE4BC
MVDDLEADLSLIRDAAREGATIAMRHFGKNPETWLKNDVSPVTAADIAVDTFLRESLLAARPDYGWLSEETVDNPERLRARRTFVVDPIDGTRAFIAGRPTWCVSIAIVEAGVSLVGVLDCPVIGEIYQASAQGPALCNGSVINVAGARSDGLKIAGPKAMLDRAPDYLRQTAPVAYIPSLAYRVAMVASGSIDATFVKANSHDWDLAAADLILQRAGGSVVDRSGKLLSYAGPDPRHGPLAAGSGAILRDMVAVLGSLPD